MHESGEREREREREREVGREKVAVAIRSLGTT